MGIAPKHIGIAMQMDHITFHKRYQSITAIPSIRYSGKGKSIYTVKR
jgi:hypothetical protein